MESGARLASEDLLLAAYKTMQVFGGCLTHGTCAPDASNCRHAQCKFPSSPRGIEAYLKLPQSSSGCLLLWLRFTTGKTFTGPEGQGTGNSTWGATCTSSTSQGQVWCPAWPASGRSAPSYFTCGLRKLIFVWSSVSVSLDG